MLSDRLLCELALLEEYKNKHKHLREYRIVQDDVLKIEFVLRVKRHDYEFLAIFNRYFPSQPIEILAKTDFLSAHQYKNGAMCLKWGQDNWAKDIRLVDLIGSLYELLYVENPLGKTHAKAESGEDFSFGQRVKRLGKTRILIPYATEFFDNEEGRLDFVCQSGTENSSTLVLTKINEREIYGSGLEACHAKYHIIHCDKDSADAGMLREKYAPEGTEDIVFLFFDGNDALLLFEKLDVFAKYLACDLEMKKRVGLPDEILDKRITVIGLGSVGSRVAVDLARAGFSNFLLVDDDIMMPFNVVRHELTYKNVGEYKVKAIKNLIEKDINERATVDVLTIAMAGQESSSVTNWFLEECSKSLLIIDCTANDLLLIMLSQMAEEHNIPIISGTVIPGGLGNIILIRKANDVDMESILASFYQWASTRTIFANKVNDYSAAYGDQTFVATMGDCSILSGMISKFAINLLQGKDSDITNINVFSTSEYGSLETFYRTYRINANSPPEDEEEYDPDFIELGRRIYEDYCSKKPSY